MLLKNNSIYRRLSATCFFVKTPAIIVIFLSIGLTAVQAQVNGCPDPAAVNYNSAATVNDGTCTYNNVSIKATLNANLVTKLNESSGLLYWNNQVWTHNDSGGEPAIYAIDTTTGAIIRKVAVKNVTNVDWEDLAQDDTFIYIGDIGNNTNGNRRDLKIYKIKKADVLIKNAVNAAIINYSYSDQTNFNATGNNNTNFDCEAMIAYGSNLYLFSKDWVDNKTRLYKLPKKSGTFVAQNMGELNVQGLITGAEVIADKRVIVLTGYDAVVNPFIYLLYDFTDNRFFDANKRKATIPQSFLQVEGICAISGTQFYISNERLESFFTTRAKLQTLNLALLLNPYYNTLSAKQAPLVTYTFNRARAADGLPVAGK